MPDEINSTVQMLGIGPAFRKHPVDMYFYLHGDKNIFSSSPNKNN